MAITPTYSWPLPDDTDLVKDGAKAIRDLGNAIDTTVGTLPGAGLVHIETQTVSAVGAIIFNNVFSSTYQTYKIIVDEIPSTTANFTMRFRVGGADNSTSQYIRQFIFGNGSTVGAGRLGNLSSFEFAGSRVGRNLHEIIIRNPADALPKGGFHQNSSSYQDTNITTVFQAIGFYDTTVFDGFSLLTSTGTMTGTASVYGFAKA
jgi:hypothetical protein